MVKGHVSIPNSPPPARYDHINSNVQRYISLPKGTKGDQGGKGWQNLSSRSSINRVPPSTSLLPISLLLPYLSFASLFLFSYIYSPSASFLSFLFLLVYIYFSFFSLFIYIYNFSVACSLAPGCLPVARHSALSTCPSAGLEAPGVLLRVSGP